MRTHFHDRTSSHHYNNTRPNTLLHVHTYTSPQKIYIYTYITMQLSSLSTSSSSSHNDVVFNNPLVHTQQQQQPSTRPQHQCSNVRVVGPNEVKNENLANILGYIIKEMETVTARGTCGLTIRIVSSTNCSALITIDGFKHIVLKCIDKGEWMLAQEEECCVEDVHFDVGRQRLFLRLVDVTPPPPLHVKSTLNNNNNKNDTCASSWNKPLIVAGRRSSFDKFVPVNATCDATVAPSVCLVASMFATHALSMARRRNGNLWCHVHAETNARRDTVPTQQRFDCVNYHVVDVHGIAEFDVDVVDVKRWSGELPVHVLEIARTYFDVVDGIFKIRLNKTKKFMHVVEFAEIESEQLEDKYFGACATSCMDNDTGPRVFGFSLTYDTDALARKRMHAVDDVVHECSSDMNMKTSVTSPPTKRQCLR